MSGGKGNYASNAVLNSVFNAAAFPAIATLYFALFTVTPTDAGGGTEATGSGYARKSVTASTGNFATTSTEAITNASDIVFATATGDWSSGASMVAWGVFDAATSGHLLYWGPLTTAAAILNTDIATIPAGDLAVTEA